MNIVAHATPETEYERKAEALSSLLSVQLINARTEHEDALVLRSLGKHRGETIRLEPGKILRPFLEHRKQDGTCLHFLVNDTRAVGKAWVRRGTFADNEPLQVTGIKQLKAALVTYTDDTKAIVVVMEGERSEEVYTMPPNPSVNTHDTVEVIFDESGYNPHWADPVVSRR